MFLSKKYLLILIFITFIFFFSYFFFFKESYKILDITGFNLYISTAKITSTKDIANGYFQYEKFDFIPDYSFDESITKDGEYILTIIYGGGDDSVSSNKLKIKAINIGENWEILEMKYIWKCVKGRGHFWWSATNCV